ncbi:MAG: hypothetical protein IPK59_12570 [Rhodospirillaceae bacterium]|nr:hypothetical protein [Rhodospirillaceae bacterium]
MHVLDLIIQTVLLALVPFSFGVLLIAPPVRLLKWILGSTVTLSPGYTKARLEWHSTVAACSAGFAAAMTYVVATKSLGAMPLLVGGLMPVEAASSLPLVSLVLAFDFLLWRKATARVGSGAAVEGIIWVIGSNLWLVWAIFLMRLVGSLILGGPCIYASDMGRVEVDAYACSADPRLYWAEHPELWEVAQKAASHGNCPDCEAD